jgi:hypothetical protein
MIFLVGKPLLKSSGFLFFKSPTDFNYELRQAHRRHCEGAARSHPIIVIYFLIALLRSQ